MGSSTITWAHALRLDSTRSPFDSPRPPTHDAFADVQPVSWKRYNIGGLLLTIYGLQELPQHAQQIACCWLLHGRGDTQDSMAYTAAAFLHAWRAKRKHEGQKGLICVCFDQRNHGSRMIENTNNESWKQGNATHGPDMFGLYTGTAQDLSLLITQLPAYLPFKLHEHLCAGVSLGGHATWVALMKDPRVRAGLVVIGCPDYVGMMTDRAIRSKLPTVMDSDPPGRNFLGSYDFPQSLIAYVEQYDPAGMLLGELDVYSVNEALGELSAGEVKRLRPIVASTLAGKKILCLSGAKDRLVPYAAGKTFLAWLKKAIDKKTGWCNDMDLELEDIVDPDARHEFSPLMRKEAERWLCDLLDEQTSVSPDSKL